MLKTIDFWGNSLAIRLPNEVIKGLNFSKGTKVDISRVDGMLVIKPLNRRPTLDELLERMTEENTHEEVFAKPVGKEIW